MRFPVPAPRDVLNAMERGADSIEQLLAAVPRMLALIGQAEGLLERVDGLIDRIDRTREAADEAVRRTDGVVTQADGLLSQTAALVERLTPLLDRMEPSLIKLQPTLERLAETTDPSEVDALVALVDHLPILAAKMETDILPVLDSLGSVAPDLHDLLDVSRELNEMLGRLPGLGRIKRRVDEERAARGPD